MILYHFTARQHLEKIQEEGIIRLTESNISPKREHAGPDVVWLTNRPEWPEIPEGKIGFNGLIQVKTEVRITVDVDRPQRWREWAEGRGALRTWLDILSRVGGSRSWFVVTKPILCQQWLAIDFNPALENLEDRA